MEGFPEGKVKKSHGCEPRARIQYLVGYFSGRSGQPGWAQFCSRCSERVDGFVARLATAGEVSQALVQTSTMFSWWPQQAQASNGEHQKAQVHDEV